MTRPATAAELALAEQLCPQLSWDDAHVEEGGQFHTVLIANDAAVIRMARTVQASQQMPRTVRINALVAKQLNYQVPTAVSPILTRDSLSSVAMKFIPGSAHPPHHGDPLILRRLVADLAAVELAGMADDLAPPFAFRGPWTEERISECFNALPEDLRQPASAVWNQLDKLAQVPPSLVHGDLAGHNMHWLDGQLIGILDWDLASAWDPALNTAYLALWHGQDLIEQIAPDAEQAHRAQIWLGLMSLERLSDTLSRTDAPKLNKLLRKIGPRIIDAAKAAGFRGLQS
ncbi:aminoglycoside phosphotransferase family protein [Glutamicibacter sp.]|uniref:aminoglycoside phosphotransferase family protein n=1 Tax=Glutamicibacter sp. TaxID=1931995 RepID=UPI0028BDB6BF|nr:aminoglycoside phosphotransferase family protein [Glutamicibacter sp.]